MFIKSDKKLGEIKYFKAVVFKDSRGEIWTNWKNSYFNKIKYWRIYKIIK